MALMQSSMLPLGTVAPDFLLPDVRSGQQVGLKDLPVKHGLLVLFICNHCPYVLHYQDTLFACLNQYQTQGIACVAISANDVEAYPQDGPDAMRALAETHNFAFPYLYDAPQTTAQAYGAVCTPDCFLFNANLACVYRGRIDDSTPGNGRPTTLYDLRQALEACLAGHKPLDPQYPSQGCSIKWRASRTS